MNETGLEKVCSEKEGEEEDAREGDGDRIGEDDVGGASMDWKTSSRYHVRAQDKKKELTWAQRGSREKNEIKWLESFSSVNEYSRIATNSWN